MYVFIDLCVGVDGGSGINYGVFVNVGVDVNVGWYQYSVVGDECVLVYGGWWYYVEIFFLEMCFVVVSEFYWYFIEVVVFCIIDNLVIVNMEREQYCFFQLLMCYLLIVDFFSDVQCVGIKKGDNLVNCFVGYGIYISWCNVGVMFESGFNNVL